MGPIEHTLRAARKYIEHETAWLKGRHVRTTDTGCLAFCSTGAIYSAYRSEVALDEKARVQEAYGYLDRVIQQKYGTPVGADEHSPGSITVRFNDDPETSHSMVMEMFERAIEAAEEDGA